jgi:hypothetical protein
VPGVDEIAAAEMNTDMHVAWNLGNGLVVYIDVLLQELVGAVNVVLVLFPALEHGFRAEVWLGQDCFTQRWNAVLQAKLGSSN